MAHTALREAMIALFALSVFAAPSASAQSAPANPRIDAVGHLAVAREAATHRQTRRISEADFLVMRQDAKTVVLDARSEARFLDMHIKGAKNLSFPDITADSLAAIIPDKNTRILIYCNNNFTNALQAFPTKMPSASLNLSTYAALYNYGYRNVYELAPLLDAETTALPLVGRLKSG